MLRRPMNHFGVHAGILPFNWPPLHTGGKLTSNLAAGNTMILKPGEQAPSTALWICEVLKTVLPKGVIQVVLDMSTEVLQVLTTHPQVKMVSMAGPRHQVQRRRSLHRKSPRQCSSGLTGELFQIVRGFD